MSNSQIVESFLSHYQLLTPKQKRIWNYIHYFAKHYRSVFPSQSTIAEACGCHRDTVIQAIKKFKELGWLGTIKRAYRSCIYYVYEKLLGLDPKNPKTFRKKASKPTVFPTKNPTVINKNKYERKNDIDAQGAESVQNVTGDCLLDLELSSKDIRILSRLARRDSEAMAKAKEDLNILMQKDMVRNTAAFLTARWKIHHAGEGSGVPQELASIPLSQKDKTILSKYNAQDRKSFLFALEDFKSYSMIRKVGNSAAFITSRFFSYLKGESREQVDTERNKLLAEWIEARAVLPGGVSIGAFSQGVEFAAGQVCDVVVYSDRKFDEKVKRLMKRRGVKLMN